MTNEEKQVEKIIKKMNELLQQLDKLQYGVYIDCGKIKASKDGHYD